MKYGRLASGTTAAAALVVCVVARIVAAPPPAQAPKPAEPKYTELKYSADQWSYKWVGDEKLISMVGHVKFVHGDTVLQADKVDYSETARTANASGNLKIYDERNTITGDSCSFDLKAKKSTVTGNVRMVAKPKPEAQAPPAPQKASVSQPAPKDAAAAQPETQDKPKSLKSDLKGEVALTCSKLEYFYKDKKGSAQGPISIVQKDRTITADSATYSQPDQMVDLVGNVKGHDTKDKFDFTAPKVKVSLKEGSEWIQAEKASGTLYIKEEEEEAAPAEKPAEAPAPAQAAKSTE